MSFDIEGCDDNDFVTLCFEFAFEYFELFVDGVERVFGVVFEAAIGDEVVAQKTSSYYGNTSG